MKKYNAYKSSGVDWIGEVPKGWIVSKLLYCLRQAICDGPHETPKQVEDGIPFVSIDSLNDTKDIDFSVVSKFISEEDYQNYMKKAKLEKGDILFSKAATIGKTAIVGEEKFMVWSPLAILKNNPQKLNNSFLYHLVNCQRLITSIALSGSYNTQINVGMREMEKAAIPVPPLSEQAAIADYLDAKCAKIDNVVAIQQKRIELLKELKQSIITKAVTKGLDKTAKMKDSGIDWIGEVPEGWQVMKTSWVFKIGSGTTPKSDDKRYYTEDDGVNWLQTGDLNDDVIIETSKHITKQAIEEYHLKTYSQGSLVIAMYGATIGKVGLLNIDTTVNQACCVLSKSKKMTEKFAFYVFQAGKPALLREAYGGGQPNISQDIISTQKYPMPPLAEQADIVDYLDKKCAAIDRQIAKVKKQIELLNEYKQSIITECVTGKRKVC